MAGHLCAYVGGAFANPQRRRHAGTTSTGPQSRRQGRSRCGGGEPRVGDARNIYGDGLSSWVNRRARNAEIKPGMRVIDAVALLRARA
jgi:hypothetical protein